MALDLKKKSKNLIHKTFKSYDKMSLGELRVVEGETLDEFEAIKAKLNSIQEAIAKKG